MDPKKPVPKKHVDLDSIPAIKPAKDEVASYRRTARAEAPKQSNFNGILVFALVLMAIMMGFGGYTLVELQKQLEASNSLLSRADEERTRIEADIEDSGLKSNHAFRKMEQQQKDNVGEIRKLWAISHQQNKPRIEKLEVSLRSAINANKALGKNIDGFTTSLDKISVEFKTLSTDMIDVRQSMIDENTEMTTQVSVVRGQIQDQTDIVEGNKRSVAVINKQVKTLKETIASFNQYRKQTNKKLIDLQNQLRTQPEPVQQAAVPGV